MGFIDGFKRILGSEQRPTGAQSADSVLDEIGESRSPKRFRDVLRGLYFCNDEDSTSICERVVDLMKERCAEQSYLIGVMRRVYADAGEKEIDARLFDYAESLVHTLEWAVEGALFRWATYRAANSIRATSSLIRAVLQGRDELVLLRWKLHRELQSYAYILYKLAEEEKTGYADGGAALCLAADFMRTSQYVRTSEAMEARRRLPTGDVKLAENWNEKELCQFFAKEAELKYAQASPSPVNLLRCRQISGQSAPADSVLCLYETVVKLRTKHNLENVEGDHPYLKFHEKETKCHSEELSNLEDFFTGIKRKYLGYLPNIELEAEEAVLSERIDDAVRHFRDLMRRKPDQTFYALRLAEVLERHGRKAEARKYWIHASRTLGVGWRSRLASIVACARSFEYEVALLGEAPTSSRVSAIRALASHLTQRSQDALEAYFPTAFYALAESAARLNHLGAVESKDESERHEFRDAASALYTSVDDMEGLQQLESGLPRDLLKAVEIPFAIMPV